MMLANQKYNILLLVVIVLSGYVLTNDVWEQYAEAYRLFAELERKRLAVLDPEQMVERKVMLVRRKMLLAEGISSNLGTYEQNQTGVFEFLTVTAQNAGISLESLVPAVSESRTLREVAFKLRAQSGFHNAARFVNMIENGPFSISLRKLEISNENQPRPFVATSIDGIAFIVGR